MENVAEAYDNLLFKIDDIQRKLNEYIEAHNDMAKKFNELAEMVKNPSYNRYTNIDKLNSIYKGVTDK